MALIYELKRRNVLRVGSFYVVAAWLLIQVVETIFPAFGFGDGAVRAVTIVSAIGLIPVLVLAWVFEFTPEGLKKEKDVDRSRPEILGSGKRLDRVIMIMMALALTYFAIDKFLLAPATDIDSAEVFISEARDADAAPIALDASIAVLPFRNLTPDADNGYFADGTTEEVMSLLANVRDLRVISRSSSFVYKDRVVPVRQVARELNVAYVLEGSIRQANRKLRISAQLIDARSDDQQWSKTWETSTGEIFDIQNRVASDIAAQMRTTFSIGGFTERDSPTDNLEAYHVYLKARELWWERTQESINQAIELFETAIELDPGFALAHAGLAAALYINHTSKVYFDSQGNVSPGVEEWRQQARLANALDPLLAEPVLLEADYLISTQKDPEQGISLFERALALEPNSVWVNHMVSMNWAAGGALQNALALAEKAQSLDPLQHNVNGNLGRAHLLSGNDEMAVHYLNVASDLGMGGVQHQVVRAIALARIGDAAAVRANAQRMVDTLGLPASYVDLSVDLLNSGYATDVDLSEMSDIPALVKFDICLRAGMLECALDSFSERMFQPSSTPAFSLIWLEEARPLREHPQFADWLAAFNWSALMAFWTTRGWPEVCPASVEFLDCA